MLESYAAQYSSFVINEYLKKNVVANIELQVKAQLRRIGTVKKHMILRCIYNVSCVNSLTLEIP